MNCLLPPLLAFFFFPSAFMACEDIDMSDFVARCTGADALHNGGN